MCYCNIDVRYHSSQSLTPRQYAIMAMSVARHGGDVYGTHTMVSTSQDPDYTSNACMSHMYGIPAPFDARDPAFE